MFWGEGQLIHNGKYKIEKPLGSGGFAITYQALHTTLKRPVVIKTPNLSVQNDPEYPKYVERFIKEGRLLAKVCASPHPHIVQVIDLFEENNRHCLVMQYIPGMSLWKFVQEQGKLPEPQAVKYIRQIGSALVKVHKQGILHLDVTPPNIMLNFEPEMSNYKAVLIDFGIAGDMSPPSSLSRTFGNKAFAPYELIRMRKGSQRHPTMDVYCLAASLYYAVTGQCPINSFDRKLDDEELVPPKQLVPSLSDGVNQAILQGMALEAKDRPQSMQEWLNLLKSPSLAETGIQESVISGEDDLSSEKGIDYTKLRDYLAAGNWKEADLETYLVMLQAVGREKGDWIRDEELLNFPCTDLRTIDRLWVKYSNGHFGFSVQKRIYLEVGGKPDGKYYEAAWKKFGDRVGWRVKGNWILYSNVTYETSSPEGHLPSFTDVENDLMVGFEGFLLFSRMETCKL
ncbi:MAG: serine/threonine-protein kinase [Calothrix sp. MO_167.B12]|nr:serine/threonine-protein kinase [Calothrix sp. MO_167.B12]